MKHIWTAASGLTLTALLLVACFSCSTGPHDSASVQAPPPIMDEDATNETFEAPGATTADIEAIRIYADAFKNGDIPLLEKYKRFETPLERELFRRMVQQLISDPRQAPKKVQLVYLKPLSGNRLFACFLITAGDPPQVTPLTHIFNKENGAWKTVPNINPRTVLNARTMSPAQFQRHILIDQYIKLTFLPNGITHLADHLKAQVEAFRKLSAAPYNLPFQKQMIDQTEKQYESLKKLDGKPKQELQQFILKEQRNAFSPEDFDFALYLEADKNLNSSAIEIPLAEKEQTFTAEALPCLTDSFILAATVEEQSPAGAYQVSFTLTKKGDDIFSYITANNIGKQLAIVFKGKTLVAPVIRTEISGGKGLISGNFTREKAEEIANVLNRYKAQLEELLTKQSAKQE